MSSFFYIELKHPSEISVPMSYANHGRHDIALHKMPPIRGSMQFAFKALTYCGTRKLQKLIILYDNQWKVKQ